MDDHRKKVFLVDDNIANLAAGRKLLQPSYDVYPLASAEMLFKMLERTLPDLILLDIVMPDVDGYEAIRKLKANRRFADIPVIFLTSKRDEGSELQGFTLGAVDYVSKPFSAPLLKKRIEHQLLILQQKETIQRHADSLMELVQEKIQEVFGLQNAILNTVADLVEFRDNYTGGHTMRTQMYMEALLYKMLETGRYAASVADWNMDFILPSAQLHDVGKIAISDAILNKPGKLTAEEYEIMKTHVKIGADAVRRIMRSTPSHTFLRHALNLVEAHHEKWDGTGYPGGLEGESIPLEGRLMAVVDVYDALTSWRPYKQALPHRQAVQMIVADRGLHFDPALVDIFLEIEDKFEHISNKDK